MLPVILVALDRKQPDLTWRGQLLPLHLKVVPGGWVILSESRGECTHAPSNEGEVPPDLGTRSTHATSGGGDEPIEGDRQTAEREPGNRISASTATLPASRFKAIPDHHPRRTATL